MSVRIPSNAEIESLLIDHFNLTKYTVKHRKTLDSNYFAHLETITFNESPNVNYVLKSVIPYFQSELFAHELVDSYAINGAKLVYSTIDNTKNLQFLIMEKIDNFSQFSVDLYTLLEASLKLAILHRGFSIEIQKKIKHTHLPVFSPSWYSQNAINIMNNVEKVFSLSRVKNKFEEVVHNKFQREIQKISDQSFFSEVEKQWPITLVHGDFDSGNIISINHEGGTPEICAIDWGFAHIACPLVDIGHLIDSLGHQVTMHQKNKILIIYSEMMTGYGHEETAIGNYLAYGVLMHLLFFINFNAKAVLNAWVPVPWVYENILNSVQKVTQIIEALTN